MHHTLSSTPGNVQWGRWDGSLPPVLKIASGDRVTIETLSGEPEDMPAPELGFDRLAEQVEIPTEVVDGYDELLVAAERIG